MDARTVSVPATFIERLVARDVITIAAHEAEKCCGIPRDEDGFCQYRPGHPIYVKVESSNGISE